MVETVRTGGLEMRFFQTKDTTDGSLDLFELTLQPNAHRPVPHHHESWDETVHGLEGTTTWTVRSIRSIRREPFHKAWRRSRLPERSAGTGESSSVLAPGMLGVQFCREMAELFDGHVARREQDEGLDASQRPDPRLNLTTLEGSLSGARSLIDG